MLSSKKLDLCECGGAIVPTAEAGRTRTVRFLRETHFVIPAYFEIPTCDGCGAEQLSLELEELLIQVLNNKQLVYERA